MLDLWVRIVADSDSQAAKFRSLMLLADRSKVLSLPLDG